MSHWQLSGKVHLKSPGAPRVAEAEARPLSQLRAPSSDPASSGRRAEAGTLVCSRGAQGTAAAIRANVSNCRVGRNSGAVTGSVGTAALGVVLPRPGVWLWISSQ